MSKDGAWGKAPDKKTYQWKKNESIINKNPTLRKMRDTAEGFKPGSTISTGVNDQQYKDNFDKIQWAKPEEKEKPKFRIKVNGRYIDDEEK